MWWPEREGKGLEFEAALDQVFVFNFKRRSFVPKEMLKIVSAIIYYVQLVDVVAVVSLVVVAAAAFMHKFM